MRAHPGLQRARPASYTDWFTGTRVCASGFQGPVASFITITTDFGLRDPYVAAMKGVMLGINPDVQLIDISHEVAPYDVMEAAFVLRHALPYFPPGGVHLAVVDPGVGTARKPIVVQAGGRYFVGPDNGLLKLVLGAEAIDAVFHLDQPAFWRTAQPAATFHGRDVFAPAAAHLSRGALPAQLGSPLAELTPLHWALPVADDDGVTGWVVHIDRYGNCITNIPGAYAESPPPGRYVKTYVGACIINRFERAYAEAAAGDPLVLVGSSGYVEIAVNAGNAAELLGIRRGASVSIVYAERPHPEARVSAWTED